MEPDDITDDHILSWIADSGTDGFAYVLSALDPRLIAEAMAQLPSLDRDALMDELARLNLLPTNP